MFIPRMVDVVNDNSVYYVTPSPNLPLGAHYECQLPFWRTNGIQTVKKKQRKIEKLRITVN